MNYALLLAGGSGTRMGNTGVPKQFLTLKDKPIIIHSLENLLKCHLVDRIIIVCNQDYLAYLHNLLAEYNLANSAEIVKGGGTRLASTMSGVNHIKNRYGVNEDDVFIAHDSVRIFTSQRIFKENLEMAHKYGAATTVYYLEETIHKAGDDGLLYKTYLRENRFSGQSPQTFNLCQFSDCYAKITDEQKNTFTDLADIFYANNKKIYPVLGEKDNIKITTPFDLTLATLRLS